MGNCWRSFGGALLVLGLLAQTGFGQTNSAPPLSSNRWLLVVETSHAMAARVQSARQIAAWMVASGMNGQMRAGDTLGVWTFDADLHDGRFPLQQWRPASSRTIARRVYEFLSNQRFENQGRLERVMPALDKVIGSSDFITVALITDGLEGIHGTPFADKINASFEAWRGEQERKQMPFVTLLRGQHGRLTSYVVNTPPWPLQMLAAPPPPAPAKASKPEAATEPPKAPTRVLPPLIIHGGESEAASKQSVPKAAAETAVASAPVTNLEPASETPPKAIANTQSTPTTSQTGQGSVSEPTSVPQTVAKPVEKATESPRKAAPAQTSNGSVTPSPALLKEESSRKAGAGAHQQSNVQAGSGAALAGLAESSPPKAEPPPAALESATRESGPAAAANESALAKTTNPPTEVGEAIAPTAFYHWSLVWIGLLVFAFIVFALVLLRIRRSRSSDRISLITRSLDRDK